MNLSLIGLGSENEKPAYLNRRTRYFSSSSWILGTPDYACSGAVKTWFAGKASVDDGSILLLSRLAFGVHSPEPILE